MINCENIFSLEICKNKNINIIVLRKNVNNTIYEKKNLYIITSIINDIVNIKNLKTNSNIKITLKEFIELYTKFHFSQYELDKKSWKPTKSLCTKCFINCIKNKINYIIDYDISSKTIRSFISYGKYNLNGISIVEFFTNPNYRHKGLGLNLLKCIQDISKTMNKKYLYLGVESNNQNTINIYKKYGFKECKNE